MCQKYFGHKRFYPRRKFVSYWAKKGNFQRAAGYRTFNFVAVIKNLQSPKGSDKIKANIVDPNQVIKKTIFAFILANFGKVKGNNNE